MRPRLVRLILARLETRTVPAGVAWTGGPGGTATDWLDPANWIDDQSVNRLPGPGDVATLGNTASGAQPVIVVNGSTVVGSVQSNRQIELSAGALAIGAAVSAFSSLTLGGGTLDPASGATLSASQIFGPGTLTVPAARTLMLTITTVAAPLANEGTLVIGRGNSTLSGAVTATAGSTLRLQADGINGFDVANLIAPGFINHGTIELTSVNGVASTALLITGGTLTNAADGTIRALAGGGGARGIGPALGTSLVNAGALFVETGAALGVSIGLTWEGGAIAGGGTLDLNGFSVDSTVTITAGAELAAPADATLILDGTRVNGPGTFAVPLGRTQILYQTVLAAPVVNQGTLAAFQTTVSGPVMNQGMLGTFLGTTISAALTNQGTLVAQNAAFTGNVTAAAGSILRVLGENALDPTLRSTGFVNHGTIELTGPGVVSARLLITSGTLTNAADGTIRALAGGMRTITPTAGAPMVNAGTIAIDPGQSLRIPISLTWEGGVVTGGGNLDLAGDIVIIAAGAELAAPANATLTLDSATVNGPGTLSVPAGRVQALRGTTLNAPLVNQGTLVVRGTTTIGGAFTFAAGSTLRLVGDGNLFSTLTVAGFTNHGLVEMTSVAGIGTGGGALLVVSSGTLTNAADGTIKALDGAGGGRGILPATGAPFMNAGAIVVEAGLALGIRDVIWEGGTITGGGTLDISGIGSKLTIVAGAELAVPAGASLKLDLATVNGPGRFTVRVGRTQLLVSTRVNAPLVNEGTLEARGQPTFTGAFTAAAGSTLRVISEGGASATLTAPEFTNLGLIELGSASGAAAAAGLEMTGGPLTNAAGGIITALPAAGGLHGITGAVVNQGTVNVNVSLFISSITNIGTVTVAAGQTLLTTLTNTAGGTLAGTGAVTGSVSNAGAVSPGTSPGLLTVNGNSSQSAKGTLVLELNGPTAGTEHDQLRVNGLVSLGGSLNVSVGFAPPAGTAFVVIDNDGGDAVTGTFAGLPQGATVAVGGTTFTISYTGGTGNDVTLTRTPPRVASAMINDGSAQRSRVTSLQVTFNVQMSFAGTVAAAFTVTRNGDGTVGFNAAASVVGGVTVVTLSSFTGAETEFGSLKDGRYTLTALATQISAGGLQLDGNSDGTPGDNYTFADAQGLYRYYGDMNGDRRVDISDFGFFSFAFLQPPNYNAALDFNNDGRIDIADFGQFSVRFFTTLP